MTTTTAQKTSIPADWQQQLDNHRRLYDTAGSTWAAFVEAVKNDGDSAAAWTTHLRAVHAANNEAKRINNQVRAAAARHHAARYATWRELAVEANTLNGRIGDGVPAVGRTEYPARLKAWRAALEDYMGKPVDDAEFAAWEGHVALNRLLPDPPRDGVAMLLASPLRADTYNGLVPEAKLRANTYSAALDLAFTLAYAEQQ